MDTPSSSPPNTEPDMPDPEPGFTASGYKVQQPQETKIYDFSTTGQRVAQATDGLAGASVHATRTGILRESTPSHQLDFLNECSRATYSERCQRSAPPTVQEDISTKNVQIVPNKEVPENKVCSSVDNKQNCVEKNGQFKAPTLSKRKENKCKRKSTGEDQTDIPISVDQAPVSENSSREEDKPLHLQSNSVSTDERAAKGKHKASKPDVKPGDSIAIRRLKGCLHYYHYVIYIGEGKVVHFRGRCRDSPCCGKTAKIKEENFDDVIGPEDYPYLQIESGSWNGKEPFPPDIIIERAKSKIEQQGFNLFSNNCEHFARWARYGKSVSTQINNFFVCCMLSNVHK